MRRLAISILVLAVLAASCSGGDEEIGRVGDVSIRLSDLEALYDVDTLPIDDDFRVALFRLVAFEALTQGARAEFGIEADPARVEEVVGELRTSMEEAGLTPAQFMGVEGASAEMLRFNAEIVALRKAVVDRLVLQDDVVAAVFADPLALTNVCTRHILVETQEEADGVVLRLGEGADFAAVAAEVSIDSSTAENGGDLGCASASRYVEPFAVAAAEAPLGEVFGPVETQFGFHVLVVDERTQPTPEQYLADPTAWLSDDDLAGLWSDWLNEVLQAADASVGERYGTWSPVGVVAPEG